MNKTVTALILAVAFMFVASISSAATSTLTAGQTGVCIQASWTTTEEGCTYSVDLILSKD